MVNLSILIFIITLILLVCGIVELVLLNDIITELDTNITTLSQEFPLYKDNIIQLSDQVEKVKNKWEKKENLMGLMFNHKELSTITDSLIKLHTYVTQNNYEEALVELNILDHYSSKNTHIMSFSFNNVLKLKI